MTAQLVNTRGAVARLGVSESFLNKLRIVGRGPPFAKLAGAVRYDIAELDLWVRSRTRRSTSEPDRRWGWPRTAARPATRVKARKVVAHKRARKAEPVA